MSKNKSAGILLYRFGDEDRIEIMLVHPGGPYFKNKDVGSWSVPKGLMDDNEDPLAAAIREFKEELGQELKAANFIELKPVKQKAGKIVYAWAAEGNIDVSIVQSNRFKMEFPYKSGKWIEVPEVDKAAWFDVETAKEKINTAQVALIEELITVLTHEGKVSA